MWIILTVQTLSTLLPLTIAFDYHYEGRIFRGAPQGTKVTLHPKFSTELEEYRGCFPRVDKGSSLFRWDISELTLVSLKKTELPLGESYVVQVGMYCADGTTKNYEVAVRSSATNKQYPKFNRTRYLFHVKDNLKRDDIVGTIAADDKDPVIYNSELTFSLHGQDIDKFSLEGRGGIVWTGEAMDSADKPLKETYHIVAQACDYGSPQHCAMVDIRIKPVALTGPRNVKITLATETYQIVEFDRPDYGSATTYTIHVIPETNEDGRRVYKKTIVSKANQEHYQVITRERIEPGILYYVIVHAKNGRTETPSDTAEIAAGNLDENVSCDGYCYETGGAPACSGHPRQYEQFIEDGQPQCSCFPGFIGPDCSTRVPCPQMVESTSFGPVIWQETPVNSTRHAKCPFGPGIIIGFRDCLQNNVTGLPYWGKSNFSFGHAGSCISKDKLQGQITIYHIMAFRDQKKPMSEEKLDQIADQIDIWMQSAYADRQIAQGVLTLLGQVVTANWSQDNGNKEDLRAKYRRLLINFADNVIPQRGNSFEISSQNIHIKVQDFPNDWNLPEHQYKDRLGHNVRIEVPKESLVAGKEVFHTDRDSNRSARLRTIYMANSTFYLTPTGSHHTPVVEIGFSRVNGVSRLNEPVIYAVKMGKAEDSMNNYSCVSYDEKNNRWSKRGIVTEINDGEVVCASSHLTGFSILLDFDGYNEQDENHRDILNVLSWIGCTLSMIGLFLTILTYSFFRSLNRDQAGKILLNLCIAMFCLNLCFILSSLRPYANFSTAGCTLIGCLLHFSTLSALLWMGVEAVNMHYMLVRVFASLETWFLLKRLIIAWGLPALIVFIILAIDVEYYQDDRDNYCRLSPTYAAVYYGAYLGPACLILLVNCCVFALVIKVLIESSHTSLRKSSRSTRDSKQSTIAIQVRGALTVMVLLGVTWVLGVFAQGAMRVPFMYIFCVLNSLQGFIIFLVRCLFYEEARQAWLLLLRTGRFKQHRGKVLTGSGAVVTTNGSGNTHRDKCCTDKTNTRKTHDANGNNGRSPEQTVPLIKIEEQIKIEEKIEEIRIRKSQEDPNALQARKKADLSLRLNRNSWKFMDDPASPDGPFPIPNPMIM